ncbi:MAG: lnt [Deltaproteobacteria bacterium]|nr:lnt [Deltaproteobacteria bacterium]
MGLFIYSSKVNMSSKSFALLLSAILLAAPYLAPSLFPLAWISFVPLFWVIGKAETWRRAVLYGWLMGTVAHLLGFHWLVYTINVFGGFPYPISSLVFLIYAILQGLQMALFALLVRRFGFGPLQILPGVFWVALEFWFPLLFPWYLANSQVSFSLFIQSADLVGPYGASFVLMWFNAAVYRLVCAGKEERRSRIRALGYCAMCALLSLIYGYQRLATVTDEIAAARKLPVAAVQGNIDIDLKWNPALVKQNLEKHKNLTSQLEAVPLVIWPESAVEVWLPDQLQYLPEDLMPQLKSPQSHLIFGAKSFRGRPGTADFQAFNTAFFADSAGRVLGRYHKQVLLAFGEYLPFAKVLALLPAMPFADGFTAGRGAVTFEMPGDIRIGSLICYEDLMPELSRNFVKETRANLLINLTNDAWYGKSVGPWQHARLAQSRAIETRRSLLRVTNTGVTSLINAKGELVQSLPMFVPKLLKAEVDILTGETYYVRYGDWFAWAITINTVAIVFFHLKRAITDE